MDIAILLYEGFTALDAIGPYETLGRVPGAKVTFVATATGPVRTDQGSLAITADATLDELAHPDILVIPGGPGTEQAMGDEATLAWLRAAHETSTWTTSGARPRSPSPDGWCCSCTDRVTSPSSARNSPGSSLIVTRCAPSSRRSSNIRETTARSRPWPDGSG